jgi:hypothetical protein
MPGPPPDFDLACAVALGFVEHPRLVVNLHQLTLLDQRGQPAATYRDWLSQLDKLHIVVREFLSAKTIAQQATAQSTGFGSAGWGMAATARTRDGANTKAISLKAEARQHLAERGVFVRAKGLGLRVNL